VTAKPALAWLGTVVRLALGGIWLWAAWSKLGSPREFTQTVRAYDATPEWLAKAIGYGLPVIELCLAALLVLGVAVRLAAGVSAALFLVFLIGLAQAAVRGIQLECGCFGGGGTTEGGTHYTLDILRDLGLLVLAAYLIVFSRTRISIDEFLARHDTVEMPSPKRMRTEQGRRKYAADVEARRKAALDRTLYLNGSLAIVVILIGVVGIGVQANRAKIEGSLTAAHASASNGVVYGKKAAATVDVYEDFQCPNCLAFEQSARATLEADVKANRAQVRYHTLSFLDRSSNGNRYSSRAANAALCASDVSVDKFVAYHDVLFGKDKKGKPVQPTEGTNGRTDQQLIDYADGIGLTSSQLSTFNACVTSEQHKALVEAITEKASERGVVATPSIYVNGKKLGDATLKTLKKAIAGADAKGPAPHPSPTKATGSATASTSSSSAAPSTPPAAAGTSSTPKP
jgi:protein-disulfide isomerase